MSRKTLSGLAVAFVALALMLSSVAASVTFDSSTGIGFVGKGDVQLVLGLNNAGVQALGNPSFTYNATTVSEVSWECTNENNDRVQERARTTTTETSGIVSSIARERNQITGYILNGYSGTPSSTSSTDGPPVNSCPNSAGNWVLTSPAGDPVVISQTGGLYVNGVLLQ